MNDPLNSLDAKDLTACYREHNGKVSDKCSSYLGVYEELFRPFRDRPIRILEIGVRNGGSLEIWSRYFPAAERIVGSDVNPDCAKLTYADQRISVVVGNANSPACFAKIIRISDKYDIIIDDGSHRSSEVVTNFARYFPLLAENGLYIAEDLHCGYLGSFEGGIEAPYSSMNFFKRLADYVNREHWGAPIATEAALAFFAKYWRTTFDGPSLEFIEQVSFRNSLCIVSKGVAKANCLGPRVIAGSLALVEPGVVGSNGAAHCANDETLNPFGPTAPRLEELAAKCAEVENELRAARSNLGMMMAALSNADAARWNLEVKCNTLTEQLTEREASAAAANAARAQLAETVSHLENARTQVANELAHTKSRRA